MSWHQSEAEAKAATEKAKATILAQVPKWEAAGIEEVKCLYDGTGDEGSISGFEFDGEAVGDSYSSADLDRNGIPREVYKAFEELTFADVSYDNEGGGGEIVVIIPNSIRQITVPTITRHEYSYVTDREYASEEPEVL